MVNAYPHLESGAWSTVQVGTTVALGAWQLSRYGWKTELLDARKAQLALPPISLDAAL